MAKFCKYCGKELKKGEKCECKNSNQNVQESNSKEFEKAKNTIKMEVSNSSKRYFQKLGNILKNIFGNFKDVRNDFIDQDDQTFTLIILGVSALIFAFCSVSFLKGIYISMNQNMSSYYNYVNQAVSFNDILHFSYFKILCCIFIGVILGYLLLSATYYLGFEKISQNHISFRKTLAVIAISVVESTLAFVISAFLTIFSYKLSILCIMYAILLFMINLYDGFLYATKTKSSSYNRLFVICLMIFLILAIYLIPNLFF